MMRNLLLGSLLTGFIVAAPGGPSGTSTVQGVLIDKQCSYKAETRIAPGPRLEGGIVVAYNHTRECALMPECQKSGYGVFTYETNKFLAFDDAGNRKALAIFKESKKDDDFRVEVTGEIQGGIMKVASIKLL
ncbi:MAG TPA: hypothetical protein VGG72_01785 [Bryobacteraceae bacterium]